VDSFNSDSRQEAMVAAKTSIGSKAAIIYDMSVASIFGKEYINTIAILGGVIGFWGGILVLGIIYLILVCIRRLRKHTTTEGSGGAVVRAMMGGYTEGEGGFDGRPPTRTDQIPRERKARKAHHHASFYARGPRRRDQDSGGIGLGRLGFGGGDGGTSSASQAARIKFGGISFRNRDTQSDMYATSQL